MEQAAERRHGGDFGRAFPTTIRYKLKIRFEEAAVAGCLARFNRMVSISVEKVRALTRSLERLYSAESLYQFPSTVFSALGEIIEGGVFSWDTVNLKTGEVISETSDNVLMAELVPTNPAIPMVLADAKGAIRPDCRIQWQLEQTQRYLDVFVPIGVRHQTVVALNLPGHAASVTVKRSTDLTDEEAMALSLLVPHVALAHRNLQRLESLRAAEAQVVPGPEDLERVGLTPREAEVLHWVMKGKQDEAIAGILKISVRTVHQHIGHILRKLQSESRGSAGYEATMKLKALESHPQTA
jgi:DNA-binding CsgD family transcriptional regulator